MKNRVKAFAPVLSAALVVACIGTSLSSWTPMVYEVQAMPEKEEENLAETSAEDAENDKETIQGTFELDDGVYYGSGTGYAGTISVAVTIASKSITAIDVTEVEADDTAFFTRAKGVIDEIITEQNLDVDVVSGATYSSRGIISAVKNALYGEEDSGETAADADSTGLGDTSVAETTDAAAYLDGTYYGSATGFAGTVTVEVVIADGKIASIRIVSHSDGSSYMSKASALLDEIVNGQSTNVDTVSGATYSSVGLINAVRNALAQAAVSDSAAGEAAAEAVVQTASSSDGASDTSFSAPDVSTGTTGSFPYPDGTYYGTAEGFGGDITVAVVIKDQTIASVAIISAADETPEYFEQASVLADLVVTAQSADLDVVSGATYSSEGILGAVKNALAAAQAAADTANGTASGDSGSGTNGSSDAETTGGSVNGSQNTDTGDESTDAENGSSGSESDTDTDNTTSRMYADGTYTVTVLCEPDEDEDFETYNLTAVVTIAEDKIVSVEVSGDGDSTNNAYIKRAVSGRSSSAGVVTQATALSEVTESAVEAFDTVSGATCSSVSIKEAIKEALRLAAAAQESTSGSSATAEDVSAASMDDFIKEDEEL